MESPGLSALFFFPGMLIAAAQLARILRRRFPQSSSLCFFIGGVGAYYGAEALNIYLPGTQAGFRQFGLGLALFLATGLGANPLRSAFTRLNKRSFLSALTSLATGLALSAALTLIFGGGMAAFGQRALVLAAALSLANPQSLIEPLLALGALIALSPAATARSGLLGLGITLLALPLMAKLKLRSRSSRLELAALATLTLAYVQARLAIDPAAVGLSAGLLFSAACAQDREEDSSARRLGLSASAFIAAYVTADAAPFAYPFAIALSAAAFFLYSLAKGLLVGRRRAAALSGMAAHDGSSSADYGALGAGISLGIVGGATGLGYALAQGMASLFIHRPKTVQGRQAGGLRVIAAIGKHEHIAGLLTFAHSLESPDEPVRAVCVAAAKGSPGQSAQEAEEALVRVVAAGAQAGIPVLPSLIVSSSPADGLARATLERSADALILGWPSMDKTGDTDRPTIEQLAAATRVGLFVVRNGERVPAARRVALCFAAGTEQSYGFYACMQAVQRACGASAQTQCYAVGAPEALRLVSASARVDARAEALDSWRELINRLKGMGQPKPIVAIIAARPGAAAWSPLSERLALAVCESLPDAPLVFAYTAEQEAASRHEAVEVAAPGEPSIAGPDAGAWPALVNAARVSGRVFMGMGQAAIVDAIGLLTRSIFPDDRIGADRMANAFSASARREPIALEPGVLLLHAHAQGLEAPTLALGARQEGWPLAALSDPVRVMVILVSPENQGPETHLDALTQIAKAFKDKSLGEALLRGAL